MNEDPNISKLVSEKKLLEQLLLAREKAVEEQSQKLSDALRELQERAKAIEISQDALTSQTRILQLVINSIGAGVIVLPVPSVL